MFDWEAKCVSGNRKEGDLMQLYKNCIHVVCKDISCIRLVNKLMKQKQQAQQATCKHSKINYFQAQLATYYAAIYIDQAYLTLIRHLQSSNNK